MRPVAILLHDEIRQPGFLLKCVSQTQVPWRIFPPQRGDSVPSRAREFSGLAVLGSDCSVNDDRVWIGAKTAFVRDAVRTDVAVLRHCFGAQLPARSLGADVRRNSEVTGAGS
jgi:GMP synthase-like glutamine amidotransferase